MARAALVFLAASLAACCVVGGANVAADKQWAGSGAMFDAIAPRYDLINTFLSLGMHSWWRRAMVASLNLQSGVVPAVPSPLSACACRHLAKVDWGASCLSARTLVCGIQAACHGQQ